ncbi:hypothetical protein BDY19DRAFT_912563, partial [Irpex rosettiformis]
MTFIQGTLTSLLLGLNFRVLADLKTTDSRRTRGERPVRYATTVKFRHSTTPETTTSLPDSRSNSLLFSLPYHAPYQLPSHLSGGNPL